MKLSRLALAIALTPGLALAQTSSREDALKLSDTLITANRDVQQRSDSSAASTVFTREDIDRLQPSSVSELLNRVPGVQVIQNGGRGTSSSLFIRGTSSAQSLVLVDGQRIGSASAGGSPLEYLNVEQIERIEVLRGPRSAVYGADAIGGVVQIFTRRASGEGLNPRLRLGYGSRNTWERSLGLSGGNESTRFSLSASADDTRGINHTDSRVRPDSDHDAYRNNALSLNLNHRFNERLEGGFSVLDQRGESEFDYGSYGAYPYSDFQLSSYSGFLSANINERWTSRVELGHSENRYIERADDASLSGPFSTYRDSASWLNTLALDDGQSLLLGIDWYIDSLNSDTQYDEDERWNQALFVQHSWHGEVFSTELGLRHDKNEQFGSENTFNGALTYHLDADNDVILSYAEGFRAPTFNDLYWPADPMWGASSNPNLGPEKSKTYELQWRSQLAEKTLLQASLYRTDIEDAIVFVDIPRNVQKARINGFEASLQQELFGWQGNAALSIIDPRDRDSGHTLPRRAKRTLSLDLDRQFGDIGVGATWQVFSRSYDALANTEELPGYGLLSLRSNWQATSEIILGFKVDNLLDKDYTRAIHWTGAEYMGEGRTALVSVTWTPEL